MNKCLLLLFVLLSGAGFTQKKTDVSSKDLKEYVTFLHRIR